MAAIVVTAIAALVVLLRPSDLADFDAALRSHVTLSLSPNGKLQRQVAVREDGHSVIAEWVIESDVAWFDYKQQIERGLDSNYVKIADSKSEILFRQTNHADILELRFTAVARTSPRSVNVEFSGVPW